MEDVRSILTKRTIEQLENDDSNPPNKKFKIDSIDNTNENILFLELPPEVLHQIFSLLGSDHERLQVRLVCQYWFNIINYSEFKVGILLASEADEFYRVFNRYEKPISIKFVKSQFMQGVDSKFAKDSLMTAQQIKQRIKKLTQLTSLDLGGFNIEISKKMTNLQALTTMHPLRAAVSTTFTTLTKLKTTKILRSTIALPPNLVSLDFDGYSFQSKDIYINTRITELKISSVNDVLLISHPNLRKLEINYPDPQFFNTTPYPLPSTPVLPNLEKLETNVNISVRTGSNLTKLQVLANNHWEQPISISPAFNQLKKLICHNINITTASRSVLMSLESCVIENEKSSQLILEYLNSKKITRLKTIATSENCQHLNNFKRLVDLTLTIKPDCPLSSLDLSFPNLTRLELHSPYSEKLISKLTNLVELSWISESQPKTQEPLLFADLQRLTALRIKGNFSCIKVSKLTSLQLFEIDNSYRMLMEPSLEINGLSTLVTLTSLVFPSLMQYKALRNWSDLAHLTNLRKLRVLQECESEDIRYLTTLQKLTYLVIASSGQFLDCLTKLSRLQHLDLQTDYSGRLICDQIESKLPFCYYFKSL